MAQTQAQSIAQARAAHDAALIEGLDSFRGVNRDPNVHYWDEDDDETGVDEVIDFGDGTTYKISDLPVQNTMPQVSPTLDVPVAKEERFAEDFDRSWPPKRTSAQTDGMVSRSLYNDRSNRFESRTDKSPVHETAKPHHAISRHPGSHENATSHPLNLDHGNYSGAGRDGPLRSLPHGTHERPSRVQFSDHAQGTSQPIERRPSQHEDSRDGLKRLHDVAGDQRLTTDRWGRGEKHSDTMQNLPLPVSSPEHQLATPGPLPASQPAATEVKTEDLEEAQKSEMHEAAERAKRRRQQEEADREARAERARQKAKELEARVNAASGKSDSAPTESTKDTAAMVNAATSPKISKILPRPIPQATKERRPSVNEMQQPTRDIASARISQLPPPERSQARGQWRNTPGENVGSSEYLGNPNVSPNKILRRTELPATATRGRAETSETKPTLQTSSGLASTSPELRHGSNLPVDVGNAAPGESVKRHLTSPSSWRRNLDASSTPTQQPATRVDSTPLRPMGIPSQQELFKAAAEAAQAVGTSSRTIASTLHEVKLTQGSRFGESESNFDQIMARIKSAIVAENSAASHLQSPIKSTAHVAVPSGEPKAPVPDEASERPKSPSPPPRVVSSPSPPPPQPKYVALPRPLDFLITQAPLPMDPPPAWKTYAIRLPKASSDKRPFNGRSAVDSHVAHPSGWMLSWDPPLEQLNVSTLSRDEWLIPAIYVRGKAVAPVSLPKRHFQRFAAGPPTGSANVSVNRDLDSNALRHKESSQTAVIAEHDGQDFKVVVKLPARKEPSDMRQAKGHAAQRAPSFPMGRIPYAPFPEDAQTVSDLDILLVSPKPSEASASAVSTIKERPAISSAPRSVSGRRLPEGASVIIARPHGSFSEEVDAPSSMRFMVSSELDGNDILDEINNMSMDGLAETVMDSLQETAGVDTVSILFYVDMF